MLPKYIVEKIISLHIPVNDISDKVIWKTPQMENTQSK